MSEESTNLDLLKKQRAAFKGQLTYFKNQFSSASTVGTCESILRRIQIIYEKYDSVQVKLESSDDSTANDRVIFEDDYGSLESKLINKIHQLKKLDDSATTVAFHNSSINEASQGNSAVSMGIRLPELRLPCFSGVESEWLAFRDIFVDLIHSRNIEPTVKFAYLISNIREGSAYNLIEHLAVTAENYEIAWKTLCDKFNNEIGIQRFHMQEIYNIKAPQENSFKSLQVFIDTALKHYNALKSLKVQVNEWDLMLNHHLTNRLDNAQNDCGHWMHGINNQKQNKITNDLPSVHVNFEPTSVPVELKLADPLFNVPDRIDMLLGVEIYNQLFKGGFVKICKELPPLYETEFGYVVCGKAECNYVELQPTHSNVAICSLRTLDSQLRQFWELETVSVETTYSSEESQCEQHYSSNVRRLSSGRYSVALPVKANIAELGSSELAARRQFLALEKRLRTKPDIYQQYRDFMSEYIALGHMVVATNHSIAQSYFLPHHYVLRSHSTTTKLRVVFNASAKTTSQLSLNDCLMVGPTIQQSLFAIVLRFRKHVYAFCGDIAKMYRQIMVHSDQQDFQRIWWRDQPFDELQQYKLCTVTYGTASAPFLATRTLKQLSMDEHKQCPAAAIVIASDFYVDDVLTGASTISDALTLKSKLIAVLKLGGFELRKFHSNNVLLASENEPQSPTTLVLGLSWNTKTDNFEVQLDKLSTSTYCSKRNILSEICQLFDPLGLCAPIIVTAKLVMQELWILQVMGWDDPVPNNIATKWISFKTELLALTKISVPRAILVPNSTRVELHGFSDASERAFGCVIYCRVTDNTGHHHVRLLCAKSRVAPLRQQSIPRLELCAALLLAETTDKLLNMLNIDFDVIHMWSDSEITLFRIKSEPRKYATFVANRIAKIQEYTSPTDWYYINSQSNPADCVSRGFMPSELLNASLWWNGPEFLLQPVKLWPKPTSRQLRADLATLEARQSSEIVLNQSENSDHVIFHKFQSLKTLLRVVAYILRFKQNTKDKHARQSESSIHLRPIEIARASTQLIKLVQQSNFADDIKLLRSNYQISTKSTLRSLSPFLDSDGVLRVGGRLNNAPISFERKHPIVLPGNHVLSKLIVRHEHLRLLHAGPQALLYNLRLVYWITGGRNLCRTIVNQCIRCFHARPHMRQQIMGDLPVDRVAKSVRPFITVGIDFAGPFIVKHLVRSKLTLKCYICLFVCFTTKAVHLEIVMNLSTESFIACLRRFVARRGMSDKIYSDNATNFIGAKSELRDLRNLFLSQQFQEKTIDYCTSHNIEWLTIPPRSPHFGGLWESAIKSAKNHLRRAVGSSVLTVEEFHTLTAQIEACLNSRPLTAMSSDPSDINVLSPGHFLIGAPLTSLMEPSLLDLQTNKLSRFQIIQRVFQHFWKRWQVEYLAELQRRYKWQKGHSNYQVGSLVILHDDNLPPMKWSLGRIIEIHPGKDGVVRVVTVKTSKTIVKRAANRISVLPIDEDA